MLRRCVRKRHTLSDRKLDAMDDRLALASYLEARRPDRFTELVSKLIELARGARSGLRACCLELSVPTCH